MSYDVHYAALRRRLLVCVALVCFVVIHVPFARAESIGGTIRGTVRFEANGERAANATVILSPSGRITQADDEGNYEFRDVPAGRYEVIARVTRFPDAVARVEVASGSQTAADIALRLAGITEEVTVTASSADETTVNAIRPTNVVDSVELTERTHTALGEVLEYEPGIAKRSFGPGTARPVIRGFDGDRVLVLQDNLPVSSLGAQSGDHGEPINVLSLERVEVVRGPATLLYGSNAIGGVVNAITTTNNETAPSPREPRGYLTGFGGSAYDQAGGSAGFDLGLGSGFLVFANAGGQRTGDYQTPRGKVPNSFTRSYDGTAGVGYFGSRAFFRLSGTYDERLYGVPFAGLFESEEEGGEEEVASISLRMRRQNFRFNGGFRNLDSFISGVNLFADYTDYQHRELEGAEIGTIFDNEQFNFRIVAEQKRRGRLTGRFGASGFARDYRTTGVETLAPPVEQKNLAIFGLQELALNRTVLQLGARVETNRYRPGTLADEGGETRTYQDRSFTGFSGSAGVRFSIFENASLVGNFTHSYRAPALEELYNFGAHVGTLTFEIGTPTLRREIANGLDGGFRYGTRRVQLEANLFYYDFDSFVFLAPTGGIEDGLTEAIYAQADARYYGSEVNLSFGLIRDRLNVNTTFDIVEARLKDGASLPRIPPARGRVGLEFLAGGLRIEPETIFANEQTDLFTTETRTAGYTIYNLRGSYTIAREHFAHVFTVNAFNLSDKLYRNHLSFIKEFAPEVGRGVRIAYSLRFF